jgi:hypothetical protein
VAGQPRSVICRRLKLTAVSARLSGAPDIEDIEHGAIGRHGPGTSSYRFRQQLFELTKSLIFARMSSR